MARVKLITDPTELVYALRCLDTDAKKEMFTDLLKNWKTSEEIKEQYGKAGIEALKLFDKMHLLESQWRPVPKKVDPIKAYHILYDGFHIDLSSSIMDMRDVLLATIMPEKEFKKIDKRMVELAGKDGIYLQDLIDTLKKEFEGLSDTMVKTLIRRSSKVMYRGQTVDPVKIE
jgi:predicted DNA-binding ArsR family transcriptional regulator